MTVEMKKVEMMTVEMKKVEMMTVEMKIVGGMRLSLLEKAVVAEEIDNAEADEEEEECKTVERKDWMTAAEEK